MVVGLVALLLVFVGLLQIGRLALSHTRAVMEARERADQYAVDPAYHYHTTPPLYIQDWQPGADGVRYSMDDRPMNGPSDEIRTDVLSLAHPNQVAGYIGSTVLQDVEASARVVDAFRFVRGHANSEAIPIYPLLRHLVVSDESIRMEHTVWMPWTAGVDE